MTDPKPLSPYDTGAVLEPQPWHVQPLNLPSPEETERYGKVDFDNEEGETVATMRVVRTAEGYKVEITPLMDSIPLDIIINKEEDPS